MSTVAPLRARQSYRHEAFLWHGRADYVDGLLPFLVEGLDAGEAVMAVLTPEHTGWLRDELGERAAEVSFVDMVQLGRNPARIIPAWQDFLDRWCGRGLPARGVGEPIWPGRGPEEVREAQLHEALLNLAIDPDLPFWLVCPYDVERLDPQVLADVGRSHPAVATASSYAGSRDYRGHDHARALFTAELPHVDDPALDVWISDSGLATAVEEVTLQAAARDLLSDAVVTLADAVQGLVVDSVRRGASRVRVRTWDEPKGLVCEVADRTVVDDFLIGRRRPEPSHPDAVWSANQVFDLVQVRSGAAGTSVRVHLQTAPDLAVLRDGRRAALRGGPSPWR